MALTCAFVSMTGSASALDAHGSVRQVYATGLKPGTKTVLVGVGRQRASALGGVLYRGVKPGRHVLKAGPATTVVRVRSGTAAPTWPASARP